jgi:hypothetical protein
MQLLRVGSGRVFPGVPQHCRKRAADGIAKLVDLVAPPKSEVYNPGSKQWRLEEACSWLMNLISQSC